MSVLSALIPINLIKKIKSALLMFSIIYYRKLFNKYCKACGKRTRIYKPLGLRGLQYMIIGDDFKIDFYGIIEAWDEHNGFTFKPQIIIGNNVSIGKNCHIGCINKIEIQDNVLIGSGVLITDHSHGRCCSEELQVPPNKRKLYSKGEITIKQNVWIGENVSILPGVTIGNNSIIGANSVVTRDIPDNCVACGNPAKIVKNL